MSIIETLVDELFDETSVEDVPVAPDETSAEEVSEAFPEEAVVDTSIGLPLSFAILFM